MPNYNASEGIATPPFETNPMTPHTQIMRTPAGPLATPKMSQILAPADGLGPHYGKRARSKLKDSSRTIQLDAQAVHGKPFIVGDKPEWRRVKTDELRVMSHDSLLHAFLVR